MSSKQGSKGAGAGKGKKGAKGGAEEKRDDILQAVIIADSFQDRYAPFSLEKPRCLLPLANTPMIEYTLEFLAMNGVQEVYIYCSSTNTDEVETYIYDSSRWRNGSKISPFSSLEFIRVSDARSIGDFLRDLDKRALISSDFILVHGDLVANVSLDAALAKHRARREANRENCMTVILRSAGEDDHRTKTHGITPHFVVEPSTTRCLHYEETHPLQADHYLTLDPDILEHKEFEIRSDLIDCGIDICTPDVLALWSESFDYELPRKNFLHGVLKDHELNGKFIYTEILDQGYAARASNLQMYDAISKDILGRWTYPLVPDANLIMGNSYKMTRDGVCVEDGVVIAPNATITKSVLGHRSSLGNGSSVSNSIIGDRCKIGKNVRIENSYIWNEVVIEDGAEIYHSVLADSVRVGKKSVIPAGSLLSYGVNIAPNTQLPVSPAARISLKQGDGSPATDDTSLVGENGRGAQFHESASSEYDSDSEDEDFGTEPSSLQKSLIYSLEGLNISTSSISTLATHTSVDSDEVESQVNALQNADPTKSTTATASRNRLDSLSAFSAFSDDSMTGTFHNDAVNGLLDSLRAEDTDDFDGAKLEFMGLRLANNASDSSMRRAIAVSFARRAAELTSSLDPAKAAQRALLDKKGAIKFIREVGVGGKEAEQAEFALALQNALVSQVMSKTLEAGKAGTVLAALLQQLYSHDVLEEEGVLSWWSDGRAVEGGELMATVRDKCRVLVEWLENADEEESSEEESDDE